MLQKQKTIFLLSLWFSRIIQFWSYWRFVVNLMLSPMLSRFNHHSLTCTNIALASFPENQKQWKIRWSIHGNGEKGSNPFTHPLISAHHRKMRKVVLFPPLPHFHPSNSSRRSQPGPLLTGSDDDDAGRKINSFLRQKGRHLSRK